MLEKEPQLIKALTDNARLMNKGLAKIRGLKVRYVVERQREDGRMAE